MSRKIERVQDSLEAHDRTTSMFWTKVEQHEAVQAKSAERQADLMLVAVQRLADIAARVEKSSPLENGNAMKVILVLALALLAAVAGGGILKDVLTSTLKIP